jgi:hypothetical protein
MLAVFSVIILSTSFVLPAMANDDATNPLPATSDNIDTEQGFLNVGYISIYFLDEILDQIPWEQFTHIVWQNVWVNSASDPTLHVQDGMPGTS